MAQRAIREYDAKNMLARNWKEYVGDELTFSGKLAAVGPNTDLDALARDNAWLKAEKLVVKPDMIMGKRGKHGLILLDADWAQAKAWLKEKRGSEVTIGEVTGELTHFLIEPFVKVDREYYLAYKSERFGDNVFFSTHGGVDIEENWDKVVTIPVGALDSIDDVDVESQLPEDLAPELRPKVTALIKGLFRYYRELHYAFLEINPFVIQGDAMIPLDLKCRLDDTGAFEAAGKWGDISFPAPFGRKLTPEEKYIKTLDEKSGASLKFTLLNPRGRIWTMVAGGGASVIYTDTIADLGYAHELANYGEYSGNPSTDETYEYARTILDLMTRDASGPKYLIIGGGIANFTDVAKTFTGIIKALGDYAEKMKSIPVKIYVRRGGPNYQTGLRNLREAGEKLGLDIQVFGPESHMTNIVKMAIDDLEGVSA